MREKTRGRSVLEVVFGTQEGPRADEDFVDGRLFLLREND